VEENRRIDEERKEKHQLNLLRIENKKDELNH
jgi:hypothetical protein